MDYIKEITKLSPQPDDFIVLKIDLFNEEFGPDEIVKCVKYLEEEFNTNIVAIPSSMVSAIEYMGKDALAERLEDILTWVKGYPEKGE